jgi:hypothetical protein
MKLLKGKIAKVIKALGVVKDVNYNSVIRAMSTFNRVIALIKNFIKN